MQMNPYQALPEYTRWSKSVGGKNPSEVDPACAGFPFKIETNDKVSTAGSCFAQHIARHLAGNGFNYFVVEPGHPILSVKPSLASVYNYGTYSARYGNIYTSRQLLQLFKRAYGTFLPDEPIWQNRQGQLVDPFRPQIQPDGFASVQELEYDRVHHLQCVRRMFEELDFFVFTLGLTEYWYCLSDGAALPVCPGVAGGKFDKTKYAFGNLTVSDVVADMQEFADLLVKINPKAKIVLTVSPVPLAATAENRHVLVSTTYSKSVLRVAAEMMMQTNANIGYFPSYEIITGNFSRGAYYAPNLRDVVEEGVNHVMRLFLKHATSLTIEEKASVEAEGQSAEAFYENMGRVVQTVCEEALIEASLMQKNDL